MRRRAIYVGSFVLMAVMAISGSSADAEMIGNKLWNLRENTQAFFANNDSWVRPWRFNQDDGWGSFAGGHQGDFLWLTNSTTGNPLDGSLSIARGVDHQFDAWTFLYVSTPTTVSLTGDGDCVPRWFLNYAFDSPQQFPLGTPASINLAAGWNRLDITGYNQSDGFLFTTNALASQVSIMNTTIIPEPSSIRALASLLLAGGVVWVVRNRRTLRTVFALLAGLVCLTSFANAETIGDHLWNLRENDWDYFHDNVPFIRPWRFNQDDGWGMFVGPAPYGGPFLWDTSSTIGNPSDGSLSILRGVDHQFDAWTFLYVPTPTTVSLTGDGDCVPRWFLNYAFDSPQQFPLGSPATINLSAGWNRLDITGYNQNAGFLFESSALVGQVAIMNTSPVPEPSTICALISLLLAGGLTWLIRNRRTLRTMLTLLAVVPCLTSFASAETIGNNLWNLRENSEDFFHDNDSWVRPWRTTVDDGHGMFQGGHQFDFGWYTSSTAGNPLDGSLSIARGVDHQFDAWTFLYVSTPTTISLTGDGDCVQRWFLNYAFDSSQQFPLSSPASISLSAGWNRLDITGYNQNAGFLFESGALASQVSIMNTAPVPEPSAICALASLLLAGGLVWLIRNRRTLRTVLALLAGLVCLTSFADAETIGNDLWNLRENSQDFFHDNDSWVRPWRGPADDGWGIFQGGHQLMFSWDAFSTTGNALDGSLSIARGVDHQFDAWTYLYVPTPTTVSLTGDGDCVPRWFLNYAFDSPQQFPLGSPATINLSAGWNRLDITGYNQNAGFLFESSALASQVAIMNTSPVPEPSTFAMVAAGVGMGGLVLLTRRRIAWRKGLQTFASRGS